MYSGLDYAADSSHVEGGSIKTLEIVYFHVILASFAVRFFFAFFFAKFSLKLILVQLSRLCSSQSCETKYKVFLSFKRAKI